MVHEERMKQRCHIWLDSCVGAAVAGFPEACSLHACRMPNVSARMVELLQQFCEQHLQAK